MDSIKDYDSDGSFSLRDLGLAIVITRTVAGLSQARLARLAKLSVERIDLIERGYADPNIGEIIRICSVLELRPVMFFSLAEQLHSNIKARDETEIDH